MKSALSAPYDNNAAPSQTDRQTNKQTDRRRTSSRTHRALKSNLIIM